VRKKTYEPRLMCWVGLGFIPSKKIPKQDFLDGTLMGVASLKPFFATRNKTRLRDSKTIT